MKRFSALILAVVAAHCAAEAPLRGRNLELTSAEALNLTARMAALEEKLESSVLGLSQSNDRAWQLTNSFAILQMQAGFAMLEVSRRL